MNNFVYISTIVAGKKANILRIKIKETLDQIVIEPCFGTSRLKNTRNIHSTRHLDCIHNKLGRLTYAEHERPSLYEVTNYELLYCVQVSPVISTRAFTALAGDEFIISENMQHDYFVYIFLAEKADTSLLEILHKYKEMKYIQKEYEYYNLIIVSQPIRGITTTAITNWTQRYLEESNGAPFRPYSPY